MWDATLMREDVECNGFEVDAKPMEKVIVLGKVIVLVYFRPLCWDLKPCILQRNRSPAR